MTAMIQGDRALLHSLRNTLVHEATRLHVLDGDPALLWAGETLSRVLEPRVLSGGMHDWVVHAALEILLEAALRVGGNAPIIRRAKTLLAS